MTRLLSAILISALPLAASAAEAPKPWSGLKPASVAWISPDDLRKAKATSQKPILYDFTAAWCGPCKMLRQQVFENSAFAAWINAHFIPVEVVDRVREDGRNSEHIRNLQLRFHIQGFPTLVVEGRAGATFQTAGFGWAERTQSWLFESLTKVK